MRTPAVTPAADGLQQGSADSGEDPDSPGAHLPGAAPGAAPSRAHSPQPPLPRGVQAIGRSRVAGATEGGLPGRSDSGGRPDAADDPGDVLSGSFAWLAGAGLGLITLIVPLATVVADRSLGPTAQPTPPIPVPSSLARDGSAFPARITGPGTGEPVGRNSSWKPQ